MVHVTMIADDEDGNVRGYLGQLAFNVLERPLFGDVVDQDASVGVLVDIDELGVQGGFHGRQIGWHPGATALTVVEFESGRGGDSLLKEIAFLLGPIDHVPDLDLDDVVGRLVVPLNVGHFDLIAGLIGFAERLTLQSHPQACLSYVAVASNDDFHLILQQQINQSLELGQRVTSKNIDFGSQRVRISTLVRTRGVAESQPYSKSHQVRLKYSKDTDTETCGRRYLRGLDHCCTRYATQELP